MTRFIDSVIAVSFGILIASGCAKPAPAPLPAPPKQPSTNIDVWMKRATEYGVNWSAAQPKDSVLFFIASGYAWMGRHDDAMATEMREPAGFIRANNMSFIACSAVSAGETERALEIVNKIDPEFRSRVLWLVVSSFADRHNFAAAAKVVDMMDRPADLGRANYIIATAQAKAGQYDNALETTKKLADKTPDDAKSKAELLDLIEKCRREETHEQPKPRKDMQAPLCEALREDIALPGDLHDLLSIHEAETTANEQDSGDLRSTIWRQIAWAFYLQGDKDDCRRVLPAAEKRIAGAEHILVKAVNLAALADLRLELGEKDAARVLAAKIGQLDFSRREDPPEPGENPVNELARGIYGGIDFALLVPYVVDVIVRCGDVDGAARLLERLPKLEMIGTEIPSATAARWAFFGASCAAVGRLDEVDKRLDGLPNDAARALMCVGVADGLYRRPSPGRAAE